MTTITVLGLSFDTHDALRVARFWADALGGQLADGANTQDAVVLPGDDFRTGPRLAFHQVPEDKTVKNRVHLDLITSDFDRESARLVSLGATRIRDVERGSARWTTFADPEGNEFDLVSA